MDREVKQTPPRGGLIVAELRDGSTVTCTFQPGRGWIYANSSLHIFVVSEAMMKSWRPAT